MIIMDPSRLIYVCTILLLTPAVAALGQSDGLRPENVGRLLSTQHWIGYAPTNYFPNESPPVLPPESSLRADLTILREAGFTGLITYGTQVEAIPRIAEELGFKAMLLGIWDPFNATERTQALNAVRQHGGLVRGLIVGNEGLTTGRYGTEALCKAMTEIKNASGKPVSTTEPVDWLLSDRTIGNCLSFVTVNAHPYFSNRKSPNEAVRWTVEAWDALRKQYPAKALLLKEVGLASAGDEGLTEQAQKEYYQNLAKTQVIFAYFEAFDATPRFKQGLIEQAWGLWTSDRHPKAVVAVLPWRDPPMAVDHQRQNPYAAEGTAQSMGRMDSLHQLRSDTENLASTASTAVDLCTVAELYKRLGDPRAREYYEKAIDKDREEPTYELLYGDFFRLRGAGLQPLFPEAERHLFAAREKLNRLERDPARRSQWDSATEERLRRSFASLYERDGFQLASRWSPSQLSESPERRP